MASWLPEILFEIVGQGKAPSKDHYQMLVTRSQQFGIYYGDAKYKKIPAFQEFIIRCGVGGIVVIFRWWKISLRSGYQSTKPGEVKESHEDFRENSHLQIQIALVFGARILDYVFNLCEGRIDFLERFSDDLLMRIISYLGIEDIASLSLTSHRFSKLCTSDKLWEPIIEASGEITPAMKALAQDQGWRQKFFIRKLHLHKKQNQKSQAVSQ